MPDGPTTVDGDLPEDGRPRRERLRRWWPAAVALWLVPAVLFLVLDTYDTSAAALVPAVGVPTLLAVLWVTGAIGGARGAAVGAGLVALAIYWAWWFGWGLDANISAFSLELAAQGLVDAAQFHLALAILLWPILLGVTVAWMLVAWRRGWPVWRSTGLLLLGLTVLALPRDATWSDGCNGGSGASPLITKPVATRLMDAGVGVTPSHSQTLMGCGWVSDTASWKPFWLGGDGLPAHAGHGVVAESVRIPRAKFEVPVREPGGRLPQVAVARAEQRDNLHAVIRLRQRLSALPMRFDGGAPKHPRDRDVRILGVSRQKVLAEARSSQGGWCYELIWFSPSSQPGISTADRRRYRALAAVRADDRVAITLQYRSRVLGRGAATVRAITKRRDYAALRDRFGCRWSDNHGGFPYS